MKTKKRWFLWWLLFLTQKIFDLAQSILQEAELAGRKRLGIGAVRSAST